MEELGHFELIRRDMEPVLGGMSPRIAESLGRRGMSHALAAPRLSFGWYTNGFWRWQRTNDIPHVDRLRQQLPDAGPGGERARVAGLRKTVARVVVVALLLAGVAVPIYALLGLGSRSTPRVAAGASSGSPPITGQLVATTTNLQPGTLSLTEAFGDVWVVRVGDSSSNPPAGSIRLDGATGAVKVTIPIDTVNRLEEQTRVAAAGGYVWVTEGTGDGPQIISAVDPATNSVVGTVTVPAPIFSRPIRASFGRASAPRAWTGASSRSTQYPIVL